MSVTVDTSEVDNLARDLAKAGLGMAAASEEIMTVVGRQVQEQAKAAAPVLTGALRDSIWLRGGRGWRKVGSSLRQGVFTEFGTAEHGPAQPWLFPAADEGADDIMRSLLVKAATL